MAAEQPPNAAPDPAHPGKGPGSGDDALMDQAAIDELLRQASFEDPSAMSPAAPAGGAAPAAAPAAPAPAGNAPSAAASFDASAFAAGHDLAALPDAADFKLPNFQQVMQDAQVSSIDLLRDVELNVKIELGRSRMLVEDVLKLAEGSVVELDKLAGDPVDVFVNDRLVARGEVLVLNDNFCVRVNEIVAGAKDEGL